MAKKRSPKMGKFIAFCALMLAVAVAVFYS
jgi:hypothetical protein